MTPTNPLDTFDLVSHLHRQRAFSERTFGPGARTGMVLDHIRKELAEIEADPSDASEWIDVVLLAFDGAWRAGHSPEAIVEALAAKQAKNEARNWPDWRTAEPGKAIEHDRSKERPQMTPTEAPTNPLDTIEWDGPAETWTTPLTTEQVVRLTTCVAMVDDQMIAIVAFGPERPDCISMLPDRAHFDEGDPGDTWQIRFGRMPLAAYRDLPEHGGW